MYASDGLPQEHYNTLNDPVIMAQLESEVKSFLDDYPNATIGEICESLQISSIFEDEVQMILERWKENEH